ncbi:CBS domain-containing protein [Nodosilinea sp. PGN35]|uniref:CBS domain-containing protein n=1 Tax=Nodosilinea sp. PGN35 TaxID=3020489 RepID=UPI0023B2CBBF|nr:CBS domain-containing protein [Nodosilinea sp. TSF1-S3]MDF0367155.1 CBS domain-containing protein [Nodosilinea sp. TSF1-S3]
MATAQDIMTDDVATIKGSATVAEAVQLMKFKKLHSLIVERRSPEDAYGIVTDTDVVNQVVAYGKDPKTVKVYEIMTKPCLVVNPNLGVEYVARLFAHFGVDRAPVIQNELLGIISNTDILLKSDFVENPRVPLLQKALQAEVAHARGISAAKGPYSAAGKAAWEAVAELEAELAFCQGQVPDQSAVEPVPQSALV